LKPGAIHDEPLLQAKLQAQNIRYSRYVDDIAMSSAVSLVAGQKTQLIASVYGMLRKNGLSARRDKHEIIPATKRMVATKLIINRKPSLPPKRRAKARAAVFQAEAEVKAAAEAGNAGKAVEVLTRAANQVGQLGRFHPNLAEPLKARLAEARNRLPKMPAMPVITGKSVVQDGDAETPPWMPLPEDNG